MDADQPHTDRLLLVEDSRNEAYVIRRCLSASASVCYEIAVAESLNEALAKLESAHYDLILLDLTLPDSTGLSTLEHIVAMAPEVPTVVLTGHDDDGIGMACIAAGAQDYLCKGRMTPDNLRTIVSFALGRYREAQAKLLRMVVQSDHALSSNSAVSPVTQSLSGASPIRDRDPTAFPKFQTDYQKLLQLYLEHLNNNKKIKPKTAMEILATQLGDAGATPRDMMDIHTSSLEVLRNNVDKIFAYRVATDSRLFALEMMGMLVEYYRTGFRRLFSGRHET